MVTTPANAINEQTTGICGFTGTAFTATAVTAHDVLLGGATSSTISQAAPSATSGVPLISQGASSDPAFGTAVVAGGGTGDTSFTAYAPICGGTTTTGALQSASTGIATSGFVLTSNGSSALPSFQAASSSQLVKQVRNTSTTATSTSTVLASTGTTPTTSNTTSLISITYSPNNASNILYFDFCAPFTTSGVNQANFFVFAGSTLIAGFPFEVPTSTQQCTATFRTYAVAGTTSSTTYAIYYAINATGTLFTLTDKTSNPLFNSTGNTNISFTISEYTP